jgi:hypothetical protein
MKDIVLALPSMPKLARALLGKGKSYDMLLTEILKYDYFCDDHHFVTPKELQQKLNMSYEQFRKQINMLYDDFMRSISGTDTALCMGDKLCEIYVHHFQKEVTFLCASFRIAPSRRADRTSIYQTYHWPRLISCATRHPRCS